MAAEFDLLPLEGIPCNGRSIVWLDESSCSDAFEDFNDFFVTGPAELPLSSARDCLLDVIQKRENQ